MGPELTDIMSALTCIVVMVAVLKMRRPQRIMRLENDKPIVAAARIHSVLPEGRRRTPPC